MERVGVMFSRGEIVITAGVAGAAIGLVIFFIGFIVAFVVGDFTMAAIGAGSLLSGLAVFLIGVVVESRERPR